MKIETNKSDKKKQTKNENTDDNLPYDPNITKQDLNTLSQKNVHTDGGDDQQLRDRIEKVDFAGKDLDVPGRNKAKKSNTGFRDEENQLFSQGGEGNENLEENNP